MEKGTRVKLTQDYQDLQGFSYQQGQLGTLSLRWASDQWVVAFDGYEASRAKHAALIASHGEGFNMVPWLGVIPANLLELENNA